MAENDLNTTNKTVMSRRGLLELVPTTDARVPVVLAQTEASISGEMDGPTFFVIGSRCSKVELARLAKTERVDVGQVMRFRQHLEIVEAESICPIMRRHEVLTPIDLKHARGQRSNITQTPVAGRKYRVLYMKNGREHRSAWLYSEARAAQGLAAMQAKYGKCNAIIYMD